MVKKIAAPRKAGPKAPARKTAKAKSVTAPKTHAPKGSPKERLAYLNKGEMKALVQRKGSPARRGPKGLPSFADDSASSKGVSRGDSSGTKGSGSTKTSTGSVSKSSSSSSSGSSGYKGGQGGQGGYNSGTSGSRFGGASTQAPGMGRNSGRVGPVSPMSGQGASFKTPDAAKKSNADYADRYGFQNKVNSRLPSAMADIEDERGRMGPFKGPLKGGLMSDDNYGPFNPNDPYTRAQQDKFIQGLADRRDAFNRGVVSDAQVSEMGDVYRNNRLGERYRPRTDLRTPQEIRERAARFGDALGRADAEADRQYYGYDKRDIGDSFRANLGRALASDRLPDVRVGAGRQGQRNQGGFNRGGMGGNRMKAGGLVKNNKKTFKDK